MIIEAIEAQKIVNRLMSILGKNINIMNRDGIIIASGDKSRIGDFHGAALDAVEQKSEVIVNEHNLLRYKGSKAGVNIPIYYKSDVLGVVGITGDPSEVKGYALIVKELVELMIQEEERRNLELFQSRAVKSFVKELVKYHSQEDYEVLYSRAKLVQFDTDIQRTLILIDIPGISSALASHSDQLEITVQRLRQKVLDEINSNCDSVFDVAVNIIDNQFVIFKSGCEDLHGFCNSLKEKLAMQLGVKAYISVGRTCKSLGDYHNSYLLARHTLEVGRRLDSKEFIYFSQDYKLQLLLHNISREEKRQFLESFGHLFTDTSDENKVELFNTVKVFFENKMSIKYTASALFVHRNTVLYRLNKFTENFNIDVTDPYECMLVYIALNLL
jgi:carbohydrate diacid regulator